MDPSQVIIRPVVSEKSYVLATADKYTFRVHKDAHKTQIKQAVEALFEVSVLSAVDRYTFRVHPDAHKTQIRQAIEELFDVRVVEVRTASVKSKPKRRGQTRGRTRAWKKAIVQVRPGQSIPIFQGLEGLEES